MFRMIRQTESKNFTFGWFQFDHFESELRKYLEMFNKTNFHHIWIECIKTKRLSFTFIKIGIKLRSNEVFQK